MGKWTDRAKTSAKVAGALMVAAATHHLIKHGPPSFLKSNPHINAIEPFGPSNFVPGQIDPFAETPAVDPFNPNGIQSISAEEANLPDPDEYGYWGTPAPIPGNLTGGALANFETQVQDNPGYNQTILNQRGLTRNGNKVVGGLMQPYEANPGFPTQQNTMEPPDASRKTVDAIMASLELPLSVRTNNPKVGMTVYTDPDISADEMNISPEQHSAAKLAMKLLDGVTKKEYGLSVDPQYHHLVASHIHNSNKPENGQMRNDFEQVGNGIIDWMGDKVGKLGHFISGHKKAVVAGALGAAALGVGIKNFDAIKHVVRNIKPSTWIPSLINSTSKIPQAFEGVPNPGSLWSTIDPNGVASDIFTKASGATSDAADVIKNAYNSAGIVASNLAGYGLSSSKFKTSDAFPKKRKGRK